MKRNPIQVYTRWLVTAILVYLLCSAVLTTFVDPWRIIAAPWAPKSLEPWRDPSEVVRTGKVAFANRGIWEVAAVGSSRVEIALSPQHPAFADTRAINLGMAAANLYETVPLAHKAIDKNPDLKTIIFGVEAGDLHSDLDRRKVTHYYQSPLYANSSKIELGVNYVFGASAFKDAIATLKRAMTKTAPERNEYGLWTQPKDPPNIRQYMEYLFNEGFLESNKQWEATPEDFSPEKADLLKGLIARCQNGGIQVHVIIPPQHALKLMHPRENRPAELPWEIDLRALVEICAEANRQRPDQPQVTLWNFSIFSPWSSEPLPADSVSVHRMGYWYDLGHARVSVGDEMLNTLLLGKTSTGEPVGVNLLDTDWTTFKQQWIEAHARYIENHPADVSWWRGHVNAPRE